jgi:probable F420-dependent oxidoreductase
VGIAFPNQLPGAAAALESFPAEVEALGYDSIWVTDHVVGTRSMEGTYESHWLESLTVLTWLAARTSRVRLGTGIVVLPHRDPVLLAKMVATIDVLSAGRIDLGVGSGWSRVEFRALGVEHLFEHRGKVSDECLEVLQLCWRGGDISYDGDHFAFRHVSFEPRCAQEPHPPIWVGGQSRAALRRAARFGDVWHPHDLPPEDIARLGAELDETAGRRVRRTARLDIADVELDALPDLVASFAAVDCEEVVLEFRSLPLDETLARTRSAAVRLFG